MADKIKALIFDLDNCIASAKAVGEDLYEPVFSAIREESNGRYDEDELQNMFFDIWRHPLDWVAEKYEFTDRMVQFVRNHFCEMKALNAMEGYGDLNEILVLPQKKYLVTSGFYELQKSKIDMLELNKYFERIFIDEVNSENRIGKEGFFKKILAEFNFSKNEVIIIGDNEDSELKVGNKLGMVTVQTLRPEVPRSDRVNFHIKTFSELGDIIGAISADEA